MPSQPASLLSEVSSILDDLRRVVRTLRESSREAEQRLGVSGAQLFVLRCLAEGEARSLNQLAARTRTHQSTVSVVVKRLVAGGYISRAVSGQDARRIELRLTKRGAALLARAPHAAQDDLIRGIERLTRRQQKQLAQALSALVAAMQLDRDVPAMFFEEDAPKPPRVAARKSARRLRVAP